MIDPAPSAAAENQRILAQATQPGTPGAQLHNAAAHGEPALHTRAGAQARQTAQAMAAAGELRPATADEMRRLDA